MNSPLAVKKHYFIYTRAHAHTHTHTYTHTHTHVHALTAS